MILLQQYIQSNPPAAELKRALAVQMTQQGYRYRQIRDVLQVSVGFITESNQRYEAEGVNGLKSKYWGTQGFLSREQKQALMAWLGSRDDWTIEEVMNHIEAEYGVVYQSRQSYYTLLQEAGFSWKKSQPTHPDKDSAQVSQKKTRFWRSYRNGEPK
jgi:transposase